MKYIVSYVLLGSLLFLTWCASTPSSVMPSSSPSHTLYLSAASVHNEYYTPVLDKIVDFQLRYAKQIIDTWIDHVKIFVDPDTRPMYAAHIADEYLIDEEMYDIWMRDFTTVNPSDPIQFTYTDASMTKKQAQDTQKQFSSRADRSRIAREKTDLLLDGGNIVDNYAWKVITTTRFLEDNDLEYEEWTSVLKDLLWATQVAILEPDDEYLAHADGMVAWIDDNVLLVNDYSSDPAFKKIVLDELTSSFPGTQISEVPVTFHENETWTREGFNSACGINLNLVMTPWALYVPVFWTPKEDVILDIIKANTSKKVITIDASEVCPLWWSVRCLTWQQEIQKR